MYELIHIQMLMSILRGRLAQARAESGGSVTTEQVIITAVLATLAITATAIIVGKVTSKANSIPTE